MSDDYVSHSANTDPGIHAAMIRDLPLDIPALCRILHGLLIHEAWIERQGFDPAAFAGQSRDTLPVSKRLDQLLKIDPRPLTIVRPGQSRALATCRDFSLMLCAVLRQHGVPARIRCGFGTYFIGHPYHDHWVCEYWARDQRRWVLVDAELDEPHRSFLRFDFEPTDVPPYGVHHRDRSVATMPDRRDRSRATRSRHDDRSVFRASQPGARSARARQDRDVAMGHVARGARTASRGERSRPVGL